METCFFPVLVLVLDQAHEFMSKLSGDDVAKGLLFDRCCRFRELILETVVELFGNDEKKLAAFEKRLNEIDKLVGIGEL